MKKGPSSADKPLKLSPNFDATPYYNQPSEVAHYASWATRGNGPALFGHPTPIICTVTRGHHNYIVSPHL